MEGFGLGITVRFLYTMGDSVGDLVGGAVGLGVGLGAGLVRWLESCYNICRRCLFGWSECGLCWGYYCHGCYCYGRRSQMSRA